MKHYEAPSISEIASVADLTRGDLFEPGSDALANIPVVGPLLDLFTGDGSMS